MCFTQVFLDFHDSSDFMKNRGVNGILPDNTKFPVKLTSFHNRSQKKFSVTVKKKGSLYEFVSLAAVL